MKRRIGPVTDTRDKTMLYGIVVNVIDMSVKISFIPHGMLPKAPLPDVVFTLGVLSERERHPQTAPAKSVTSINANAANNLHRRAAASKCNASGPAEQRLPRSQKAVHVAHDETPRGANRHASRANHDFGQLALP
jgi:hypothetical protein